ADLTGQMTNFDIHLVRQASDSSIPFRNHLLTNENVAAFKGELQFCHDGMTTDADLLFYGCNLAGGPEGLTLLRTIGALTGADVAASIDMTGAAVLGGDWNLEYQQGPIETAAAINIVAEQQWQGLLGHPNQAPVN